jgi:hypothetical protein
MPPFPADAMAPREDLLVEDEAAADPRAEDDAEDAAMALPGTIDGFG